jgi:hypothetical protein
MSSGGLLALNFARNASTPPNQRKEEMQMTELLN